ncbi:MAG TPA: Sec-independent protein translocase subunit TatA [Microbacteriaceae bacterium]|nr:Sec-independent protein translocase subunit TatA [Microbacteriaceae bacterium]
MFGNTFTGWHLVIILAIVLLLFGAPKLPALAKSVGQSMRIFRGEMKNLQKDEESERSSTSQDAGTTHREKDSGDEKPGSSAE